MRNALFNNKVIWIHDDYLKKEHNLKEDLTCNEVRYSTIVKLVEIEKQHQWKIAPHLNETMLELGSYGKMKVAPAKKILSRATGAAIRFAVKHCPPEKYGHLGFTKDDLTTAFFCEAVDQHMAIMDNHRGSMALSKLKPEKYAEALNYLEFFMKFYCSMKLHKNQGSHAAKPSQKAVLLSSVSMIRICEKLLNEANYDFAMTSHGNNDIVENLHSRVRMRDPKPTPNNYDSYLKLTAISQFFISKRGMSYNEASDAYYLGNLIDMKKVHDNAIQLLNEQDDKDDEDEDYARLDNVDELKSFVSHDSLQEGGFTHHNGFILNATIFGKKRHCDTCIQYFTAENDNDISAHELIAMKDYKPGALTRTSVAANEIFDFAEAVFKLRQDKMSKEGDIINRMTRLILMAVSKKFKDAPTCHLKRILGKFTVKRWQRLTELDDANCKRNVKQKKRSKASSHASQSMAVHSLLN